MPSPAGPGRTRPVCASEASSGSLASVPTGPVQLTRPATLTWLPSVSVTSRPVPDRRADATVPVCRTRRPASANGVQPARGLGGHPVPRDLPRASVLLDEPALVVVTQALPQLRGHRPEAVDRRAPVAGLGDRPLDVGVDDPVQLLERADPGDARRRRHQRGGRHPVRRGHQVVPRDRVQGPPRTVRSDRDVDHGQPGADQQEVTVGQLVVPGVRDIGTAEPGRRPVGARRGPGGEHDGAGDDRLTRGEAHREPVTAPGDPDHGFLPAFEAGVAGVLRRGLQQAVDVVAVHRARDEVLRLRFRVVVVAHPAEEVLGVPREGTHPAGGDVEQVAFVGRGVRRPAARSSGWGRPARSGSAATGWSPGARPSAHPRHRPPPRRHSSRPRLHASDPPLKSSNQVY